MENVETLATLARAVTLIEQGAFLTVQAGAQCNTMTIGWATLGLCWRKPILMVAVRNSRHTYGIMESAHDFCVSLPNGNLRDELFYCGTKSGRDVDKLKECGLHTRAGKKVATPIVDIPGLHIECKIMYKSAMDPSFLAERFHGLYPDKDFHTLYFGEVVACYELDDGASEPI
jgi:flavin reductase (DIM6/NTAB) family NADH-FMN oxidoreductase RutF